MTLPSFNTTEQASVPSSAPTALGRSGALSDAERLKAIIATQNAIAASELDLPSLMQLIVERTQELTEAEGAAFELREADEMVYRAASGTTAPFLGFRLPVQTSLSGRSVLAGEILKCDDSETDDRVDREACRKVGARSMIVVPLRYQGKVQGVLKVLAPTPWHFDDSDVQTLELMAGLLGALVSHASTFRVQQEEAAERERARLTEIFLSAPAFMAVLRGPEHVFERANPLYLQLVGYRDLIGRSIREALPEIAGQGFYEILDEVYQTGKPFIGKDWRVLLAEIPGAPMRECYLDFVYQPLIEANGTVSGIFVHGVDLTERKLVEVALRASEERVRLATEAAELGIWVWEPATDRVTWENDQMYALVGLSPSDEPLNAAHLLAMLHPDDATVFAQAISEPIEANEPLWFEGRFRRMDGALRWIELRGRLQESVNGEADRVVGTAADITDRKNAEEQERQAAADARAAAEANAKYRTFFEQGSYFAGVMSLDGTVVEANRLCLDFCGYTRKEVIGQKFWDCGWWNRSPELSEMIRQATEEAAAGRLFQRETRYYLADGSERFVDLIIAPIRDESGRVLFIAPTGTDITERKQAEQTLKEHTQEIADLNQRLQRAMRETHHRVKNNLQVVAAMIEMQMMDHQEDGSVPVDEFVRLKAHVHTLAIVHDLLTLTVREDEDAQRISTKAVLERLLPMLQQTAWQQNVRYSVEEVVLSSKQCIALSLILNELVSNALKHGKEQAEVFFTAEGEQATLAVYDDGPGFPEGFDAITAANTGLELVSSLVRTDLRGTITYRNQHRSGGQVTVTFALPEDEKESRSPSDRR